MNPIPSFIICGAERCATTWCWRTLQTHPDICMSHPKETDYFGTEFERGEKWYRSLFSNPDAPITGEITPWYWNNEDAIRRIAELKSQPRIILVLRNPEHRALSHWMLVNSAYRGELQDLRHEPMNDLVPGTKFIDRSMYGKLWERLIGLIPKERIRGIDLRGAARGPRGFQAEAV